MSIHGNTKATAEAIVAAFYSTSHGGTAIDVTPKVAALRALSKQIARIRSDIYDAYEEMHGSSDDDDESLLDDAGSYLDTALSEIADAIAALERFAARR